MPHTPSSPDAVPTPAPDARLFRSSPMWLFVIVLLLTLPIDLGVQLLLQVLDGADPGWRQASEALPSALAFALVGGGVAAWLLWRNRSWVRISPGGIELASQGGDPILLEWSEIVSIRVRGRGLRTVLDVVPADLNAIRGVEPAREPPRLVDTPDGTAFTLEIGALRPGPTAMRAELARRTDKVSE